MTLMSDAYRSQQSQDPPSLDEEARRDVDLGVEAVSQYGGLAGLEDRLRSAWLLDALHVRPLLKALLATLEPGSDLARMAEQADAYRGARNKMDTEAQMDRDHQNGVR